LHSVTTLFYGECFSAAIKIAKSRDPNRETETQSLNCKELHILGLIVLCTLHRLHCTSN